jgi:hypothetical protein
MPVVLLTVQMLAFSQLGVAIFDELVPVFPDTVYSAAAQLSDEPYARKKTDTTIDMPTAIHVFVPAQDGEEVVVEFNWYTWFSPLNLTDMGGGGGNTRESIPSLSISRLHTVPVEENTGVGSRTEQFEDKENPHVIRRAPFRVFDPIEPLENVARGDDTKRFKVSAIAKEGGVGFRVQVSPEKAGELTLAFGVKIGESNEKHSFRWEIKTHDVNLISRDDYGFSYTNWFSLHEIKERHGLALWSEDFWAMLRKYAELMAYGGQDTFWLRWPDFFALNKDSIWQLNTERLKRYVNLFLESGFFWIEGAPIASRPNSDWSVDWLRLNFGGVPATSEEGEAIIKEFANKVSAVFHANGWGKRWIQHLADEPTDTNADDYRKLSDIMRKHVPEIKIVEATMTRSLAGAVDIWCPQVNKYQENRDFFLEMQKKGSKVWTYTCLTPGGPWLNRLLDQEHLRQVYFGWAGYHYGTQGFLHWGLNHYKADPFAQSVVDHPAMPNTTNKLPAGDTHVVYPGPNGPWSSIRFEAHRIGIEDYAMLKMLNELSTPIEVPGQTTLFDRYDEWNKDVGYYRQVRRELMVALDSTSAE